MTIESSGKGGNGNNIKAAFEQAEQKRREMEIKAIEKHLQENGGSEEKTESHVRVKRPRARNQKKVRSQRFSPGTKPVRDYDEDGRPAVRPDTRLRSWEPEIKKEPELNRKGSRRGKHKISAEIDTLGFEQIETKPGASWTEPESTPREPRVRPPVAVEINHGPAIQIETKSASNPEAGTPVSQTSAEIEPARTPATTPETGADKLVNQANEPIIDFTFPDAQVADTVPETGGVSKIEKTPEEIAEDNRREALSVPEQFEDNYLKDVKESHDRIHYLLKRMSEDPEVTFNAKDAHFVYRVVIPSRDEKGNLTATSETAYTYHDILRLRASIPEELRKESDKTIWDWERSGKWGKIETFADTEKLWNRLGNPNDKLSKYKNEFYSLLEVAKGEQLPDEYAEAVIRGDIEREVLVKQDELFARLQTANAALDVFYERTKERDKTQEEQKEMDRVLGEKVEAEVALREYMKVTDKYEPDPLEVAPLNDIEKVRAREDELWKEFFATREMKSLDDFKRAYVLRRQWSGLRRKLEDTPVGDVEREKKKEEPNFEDRKKYLNSRNNELGAKAKEYGIKFESFVRSTGERYRKLPLKYKIGVAGALLGLNVATGGASTLVTLLTSTAMLGQRALGAASAYALIDGLYEKRLSRKEKERGSERTEFEKWKKRGYSSAAALAVFTGLPGYAVKEGFDAVGGGGMLKALGALMGISPDTAELPHTIPKPAGAPAEPLVKPLVIDEIKQQIVEENARATTEVATPQESRQALRTAVEKLTRVSATSDAKFEMPKHADFTYHGNDDSLATDLDYDVTPTDQSGADDDIVQTSEEPQTAPVAEPETQQPIVEETPRTWQEKIVPEDTSPVALDQEVSTEAPIEADEPSAETVKETPVAAETPSTSAEPPGIQAENVKEWTNTNGVKIDPLRGGVYQYPNGVPVAYGKGALEAAQDFAKANPNTSVWVQSEKPVLYEGKLHQYVYEVKYGGFWRGMQILGVDGPSDPSHIITIDPNALVKRLGE